MSFSKNKVNYAEFDKFKNFWKDKADSISVSNFCNPFIDKKKYHEIEKKYRLNNYDLENCEEPFQRLLIQNNGNVVPCCSFFGGELVVGNIYKNSIYEIWNNEKMKKLRLSFSSNNSILKYYSCQKCKISMLDVLNNKKERS